MQSVDVHQHLWPEEFVAALAKRGRAPRLRGSTLELVEGDFELDLRDHDLDRFLARLDHDELDVAVVSLQPTLGLDLLERGERDELASLWHAGTRELAAAARGRIAPLAAGVDLEGFVGACVRAEAFVDLDSAAPLLDAIERRGGVLFVHPGPVGPAGGRPDWWAGTVGYTAQMQAAFYAWLAGRGERWATLRVVFAILAGGAPFQLERLAQRGVDVRSTLDENVYFDSATYGRRAIELCIETFGVYQLLFGSDRPVADGAATLRAVRDFGDSVYEIVTMDNPAKLLS